MSNPAEPPGRIIRLGVLVSGNGTNLQSLIDAIAAGTLRAEIVLVASDKAGAYALERARASAIPAAALSPRDFANRAAFDAAMAEKLLERRAELVVLAGFMRILSRAFLDRFPGRVINLHPGLLPDDPAADEAPLPDGGFSKVFRGKDAVEQALRAGVSWTGCTVHVVTERLDAGPVLAREPVRVLPGDTPESLHARIRAVEHRILPAAVNRFAKRL